MANVQLGPQLCQTGSQLDAPFGSSIDLVPWRPPANVTNVTRDDGKSFATVGLNQFQISWLLLGTNFGFTNIPTGATILGVQFWLKRSPQFNSCARDHDVLLIKAGTFVGTNHAYTSLWPGGVTQTSYGNAGDLWGTTLTPADVMDPNFGVGISVDNQGPFNPCVMSVTAMRGAVYYQYSTNPPPTPGGGLGTGPPSNGGVTAFQRIALFPVAQGLFAFDPGNWIGVPAGVTAPPGAGFDDAVDGSSYTYRVEEIAVGRKPTVSRLFVTYLDLGQVTVTFTLVACQDDQTVVTNSATVVLGNATPTGNYLTREVDLPLSGMNMQLSWSRAASAGPLAIAKIKMTGTVETEPYI